MSLRLRDRLLSCGSLTEVVRERADATPHETAYTFVDHAAEGRPREEVLDCAELDRRARQVAALLQGRLAPGSRVLLLYAAGLDYLAAFFGCLHAGMVAVPAYPPLNARLHDRLARVADDCDAALALTTSSTLEALPDRASLPAPLARLHWLATDARLDGLEHAWRETAPAPDRLAFLQYTSGSSGVPKGVMLSHRNLLHNVRAIVSRMAFTAQDKVFSWLPPYHDMGLIGSILTPLCAAVPLVFITPHAFLRRPARWLRGIAEHGCTISGAPNFAFDLCVDKVRDDELAALDLSSWSLAFSGAEPVRRDTLARFERRFAACGFDTRAFYPCYGMAETTLIVTGKRREAPYATCAVDKDRYARDLVAVPVDAAHAPPEGLRHVVSCGVPADGMRVVVADPVSLEPLAPGRVGEILIAGESVAGGYWNREAETLAVFGAAVPGHEGAWLRSGDLGFFHDGELHVSGRLKDTLIIRGVNHFPQDIEGTVDRCHDAVRPGCGLCFAVDGPGGEQLVFVQEVAARDAARADEIVRAIRGAIVERHDVDPFAVVLIEQGSLPKTTSGKLSRRPCREAYLQGALRVVARRELRQVPEPALCPR
jgi:acyl-CoA synthetase (AMP-forming)/AMP-acid ligase II